MPERTARPRRHSVRRDRFKRPVIRSGPGVLGSGSLPGFETWRAVLRDAVFETDTTPLGPPDCPDYTGWVYLLGLGPVSVTDLGSEPVRVARTARLIRRNPVDLYTLSIAQRPAMIQSHGRQVWLRSGDALLSDPNELLSVTTQGFGHFVVLNVQRGALERGLGTYRNTLGRHIPAGNPNLRVLTTLPAESGREASCLPTATIHELGHTAIELLFSTVRPAEAGQGRLPDPALSRGAQLLRMQDFVRLHLDEPDLSPKLLAAAFAVSVRYVELAFREGGLSPARFIRETRLAQSRRLLADPRQRHQPITVLARWVGIENPTVFARNFRDRYGMTPHEYRRSAEATPNCPKGEAADAVGDG
ncbi:helix-turn-helix domain-containing protein [Embleya sp. AB8]|uniref:helix-turn-helix domain-containing protein n=1 Tax=Embleya sp. AB8 TaxID=3156304 RepID=UPI003C717109